MQFNESNHHELELIGQLMARRKAGLPLDAAAEALLNEWLSRSDQHQQAYDDFADDDLLLQETNKVEELAQYYRASNPAMAPVGRLRIFPRYARIAAVAALMGGVVLLTVFIWNKRTPPANTSTATNHSKQQDALPGSQQAVLQGADGQRYELGGQRPDSLGVWTGHQVVAGDGQLVYTPTASKTGSATTNDMNTVTTPNGGGYQVQLSDGSVIQLNAGSSVTFPTVFSEQERRITVTGEALLTVAKRADKQGNRIPFIVVAGDARIEVLGTRFNVNTYGDRYAVKTTLLEGRVAIRGPQQQQVAMVPGQRALLQATGDLRLETLSDPTADIAWSKNEFYFKDMPFDEMMKQVSRWYNVQVKYEGAVPPFKGGGYIQRNIRLSELLRQLSFTLHDKVAFEISGQVLLVRQQSSKQ